MIKTKDEWERVKVVADSQSGPSLQHAVDTIDALREVAKGNQEFRAILEQWSNAYPLDMFPEPPAGKHGDTVDACSAAMGRHVTNRLLEDFDKHVTRLPLPDWITKDDR